MTARASTSSGPKADLESSHDDRHPVAYAMVSGIAIGLLLIGLLSVDTYFHAIGPRFARSGRHGRFFRLASRAPGLLCSAPRFTRSFVLRALTSTLLSLLVLAWLIGSALVGFLLWLRHR